MSMTMSMTPSTVYIQFQSMRIEMMMTNSISLPLDKPNFTADDCAEGGDLSYLSH